MSEWQPIESAPKDGTEILLFTQHEGDEFCEEPFTAVQVGYWDEGNETPDPMWQRDPGWHQQKIGTPTHWMKLPDAPDTTSGSD